MAQFAPQLFIWHTMNGGEKVVGLYQSEKQSFIV